MENTRKYESVFIVNATLEDEAIDEVVARFSKACRGKRDT